MTGFKAILLRDLRLGLRQGGDLLTLLLLFISVGILVPFAIGPDTPLLARLAPAIVWVAALLAQLLTHDRLFRADFEDGSLIAFHHAAIPLETIVFAKLAIHWVLTGLPLMAATPFLAVMLGMETTMLGRALFALLLGTPALSAFVVLSASVTVGLKRGGLVAPVLILPLTLPVLIFGAGMMGDDTFGAASQAGLLLAALSLASVALTPFAAALALKVSGE